MGCKGTADLYKVLGEEKNLGITLRTFRAIYSGQIRPTLKFFARLFKSVPQSLRRDSILAFMESCLDSSDGGDDLICFLREEIGQRIKNEDSIWSSVSPNFLSERQLKYLGENLMALRAQNHLVCHGFIENKEAEKLGYLRCLSEMVQLDLAEKVKGGFRGKGLWYRLPVQGKFPRETVSLANRYIFSHIEAFAKLEGAPDSQEIGFSFHTCRLSDAKKIQQQILDVRNWIQRLGLKEDTTDEVGFVWVDFSRILKRGTDY